ncbi:MAG: hypothetical protein ACOY3Y_12770 [Acidobacteriota bacterium]
MRHGTRGLRTGIRVVAVAAALAAVGCAQAPLPSRLAGMRRTKVVSGPRAVQMIVRMHDSKTAPPMAAVAEYGRGGRLRVWMARYDDAGAAERILLRMVGRLSSTGAPFSPPRQSLEWPRRWFSVGPNGHHVFWAAGADVYWIEGDPAFVPRALEGLPAPSTGSWT